MTSVSEQKSVAAEYTWLAAIVSALATSQLGCGWVGRWNDGLVFHTVAVVLLLIVPVFARRK